MMQPLMSLIGRYKALALLYVQHVASTTAHGIGTMSQQAATAVNIDGGTVDGTVIGGAVTAALDATRVREARHDEGAGAAFALDWAAYAAFKISPNAAYSVTHTNKPATGKLQGIFVEVVNGGLYSPTWTGVTWVSSAPTLKSSGTDWLFFFCVDGATVYGSKMS